MKPRPPLPLPAVVAAAAALCACGAQAQSLYFNGGLPALMIGYAQPVSDSVTLRADIGALGRRTVDRTEEGIDYDGRIRTTRGGLFGDWFAFGNTFRFTGGVTFNDVKIELKGRGNGGSIRIGDNDYTVDPGESFDVKVEYPRTTPYLGIGWGHSPQAAGWGFVADVGVSIGRVKLKASTTVQGVTQEDIDRELEQLRDEVGRVRVLPQLTVGVSYRF